MPLPLIPIILGAASLAGAAFGVKKGLDAKEKFSEAKELADFAKSKYDRHYKSLESSKEETNKKLEELGKIRVEVFTNQIRHFVNFLRKGRAKLDNYAFHKEGIPNIEEYAHGLEVSIAVATSALNSGVTGAMAALGAYGAVTAFGAASTGTAIASLAGIAAQNATLAWLGGGSLAAGGLGIAGGTMVLGGIAAGAGLAAGGIILDKKAEESLTAAHEYYSKVEIEIEKMENIKTALTAIIKNVDEISDAIRQMAARYDAIVATKDLEQDENKRILIPVGMALANLLKIPVLDETGKANAGLSASVKETLTVVGYEVENG